MASKNQKAIPDPTVLLQRLSTGARQFSTTARKNQQFLPVLKSMGLRTSASLARALDDEFQTLVASLVAQLTISKTSSANGAWFGIEEQQDGRFGIRMALVKAAAGPPETWDQSRKMALEARTPPSRVLRELARADADVATKDAHVVGLLFVAFIGAAVSIAMSPASSPDGLLVYAGYEEGDYIRTGRIAGGVWSDARSTTPVPAPALKEGVQLFLLGRAPDSWLLDQPRGPDGNEVPMSFSVDARRERPSQSLSVDCNVMGKEVDFSFTVLDIPIVTKAVADLLGRIASDSLQRIPVHLIGEKGPHEILNVLHHLAPSKLIDWARLHRKPIAYAGVAKYMLMRTRRSNRSLVVQRPVAEALLQAGVTGLTLTALDKSHID